MATNNSNSAGQAAQAHFPLAELNDASNKSGGTWLVDIYCPFNDTYEYQWQGKNRKGEIFMCTLTCAQDQTKYCHAHLKKTTTNTAKHTDALKIFQNGARFVMSMVAFVTDAKTAYVSAPLKGVVDLTKTRMDPVLQGQLNDAQPVPSSTIAGSSELGANQCFDVTALVQDVGETRTHANGRSSFVVNEKDVKGFSFPSVCWKL